MLKESFFERLSIFWILKLRPEHDELLITEKFAVVRLVFFLPSEVCSGVCIRLNFVAKVLIFFSLSGIPRAAGLSGAFGVR